MSVTETDLCVIGGGSGGLSVAAGAVQMGARVVLIEGHKMGGDCLNYGCVPSKALIAAANAAHAPQQPNAFGVTPTTPDVSYQGAMEHVGRVIETIAPHDSVERFEGLGVDVRQGYAKFVSPEEVEVDGHRIRARRFVIATGSSPFVPPIPGLESVPFLTNESLFDLRKRPQHLIVIGGGPIGIEMAQAHRRLGSDVTVLEGATALSADDPDIAKVALDAIRKEGVVIEEGALVSEVSGKSGAVTVKTKDGREFEGSDLLVAVGRKPNIDKLNLDAANVAHSEKGIDVDSALKTSNRRVYAIGDVTGGMQFTHAAGYQAGIVVRSAVLGLPSKARTDHIPWATYTSPEIAQVGLTEAQAREKYKDKLKVARADFSGQDRAIAQDDTRGFIKVMVVGGRPVGASIVGPHASDLIGIWALAIANKLKMSAVTSTVLPYPTLGEINKRVAGNYFSPMIFESALLKRVVKWVQRFLP
ncbi:MULTISPECIES: dihydrolipoyl dehydrogenase family protein [Halocynthiibacter]|uniref:FAD-dependent oxidoreductase n=1 Tax=Halocynthiibacter halioticoli TaxID=2986804 RepID=A0AAE3J0F6_9RHOB|nr:MULTISPECIES: FAD-dependent oxidoreductase [Halocynthiibacter]MCV6825483.1 FAD-dependent oxidoreductase [Halocynthiibacter halioticoli]MCW4058484.1 FAD-dependent oxidoreductase [Halocynthiibacter sp. SDUM655004]